ncbi:MAG TPA: TolC family protein [Caulobacteraceae bacterium]
MRPAWILAAALLAGAAHAEPLTFHAALNLADDTAPSIAAKGKGLESARAAAIPAGQLPDPKLELGIEGFPVSGPNAFHPARSDFSDVKVGVMQDIPNGGKRRAQVDHAHALVDSAAQEVEIESLDVRSATAAAWLDLYFAQRKLAALNGLEKDIDLLKQTLSARLAAGKAMAADVTAPDEALVDLADRRADLKAQITKADSELRRWIGPAADEGLAGDPPEIAVDVNAFQAALETHPRLHRYLHMEAAADADVAEARADKRPDVGVELAYQHRDPMFGDMVMGGVTVSLPIFPGRRQDPMIASKLADANRVRIEQQAEARSLAAELDEAVADYASASARLARAKDTSLPLSERRVDLATSAYQAGTGSLSDLIDARRARTEAQLQIIDLQAEATKLAARLAIYFGGEQP